MGQSELQNSAHCLGGLYRTWGPDGLLVEADIRKPQVAWQRQPQQPTQVRKASREIAKWESIWVAEG